MRCQYCEKDLGDRVLFVKFRDNNRKDFCVCEKCLFNALCQGKFPMETIREGLSEFENKFDALEINPSRRDNK